MNLVRCGTAKTICMFERLQWTFFFEINHVRNIKHFEILLILQSDLAAVI